MVIKIIATIGACILSGIAYRLGGAKGFNTKFRDWGCPAVLIGLVLTNNSPINIFSWVMLFFTFFLSFGALTTYLDSIFGYDNHYAHGFLCGLAGIPLIWVGIPLWIILARLTLCTVGMGLFSKWIGNDLWEEFGRGVLFIL